MRLVTGLYKDKQSLYSSGIFQASVFLNGSKKIVYYTIHELLHMLDSIKSDVTESQAEYIQNSLTNTEKYLWHITDLSEYEHENVAVVESYTVEKSSTTFMDKDEIYQFKDALIIGFSDQLKLNWINHLRMDPVISNRLREYIRVKFYTDSVRISFFNRNQLSVKMIQSFETNKPVFHFQIDDFEPDLSPSKYHYSGLSEFLPWYQDFHLLIGIKSAEREQDQKIFIVRKFHYP